MKIKVLLLLVGVLVIHPKSERLQFDNRNFDLHNSPRDGSASNVGSYYPSSEGISSTFHNQGIVPTNDHGPVNYNSGSEHPFPNCRSNLGSTSDLRNSDYGSQGSVPSSRPVPQSQNDNYGSQSSLPGLRSNQGSMSGRNSSSSSSDMGSDQNFPLLWQADRTEVIDRDALRNSPNMSLDNFQSIELWRIQPLQDNTNPYDLRNLPKVVLLSSSCEPDYSKPNGTLISNGITMFSSSFHLVKNPTINDAKAIYNPFSPEAPIYITEDLNWPTFVGLVNGKVRLIFHVRRFYL